MLQSVHSSAGRRAATTACTVVGSAHVSSERRGRNSCSIAPSSRQDDDDDDSTARSATRVREAKPTTDLGVSAKASPPATTATQNRTRRLIVCKSFRTLEGLLTS